MRPAHPSALAALLLFAAWALPHGARADNDSLATVGVGAIYALGSPDAADNLVEAGRHLYGLTGRAKLLHILGLEFSELLDQDPKTQKARHLSPRYQLGMMVHVVPTDLFTLYGVGGLGAHRVGDLFDINGETTSFYAGPGLEIYAGAHAAIGGDFRFRVAGPTYLKAEVQKEMSTAPVDELVGLSIWQAGLHVTWYL